MHLPESFITQMKGLLKEEYPAFEQSIVQEQSVSIRYNPAKMETEATLSQPLEQVPWSTCGYYLKERPSFTFDPLLHAGVYYVQEASSMFLEQIIRQYVHQSVRYLDLCAAPGGKTTLAIASLPAGSLIVCNEIERKRCHILAENIAKWGSPYSVVMNNCASDFSDMTHYFDVILTDVPCSGEGMFRKDEQAIAEWSEVNVSNCVARQQEILQHIWPALRPGGLLIYSTCTYNIEEDEKMLEYICHELGATVLPVHTETEWGIHQALYGDNPVYRFMPHSTKGEGLFMAVLRKNEAQESDDRLSLLREFRKKERKKSAKSSPSGLPFPNAVKNWVRNPESFHFELVGDRLMAYPTEYADDMNMLATRLNPLQSGLLLGNMKGKDVIPAHSLALSVSFNRDAFPSVEVDFETAVAYLRREAIVLPEDTTKGFVLITYRHYPLGWVKNIGSRSNNLYPQEWRIRSGFLPQERWCAL